MATQTQQNRRLDVTPLFAVVGVTDLAVARVRTAVSNVSSVQAEAQKQIGQFDAKAAATEVPTRAVAVALETASKAEAQYEGLAERGKQLVDRLRTQAATRDLVAQANNTFSRTKGAVTTARKAADGTVTSVRSTLTVGRKEAAAVASTTTERAEAAGSTTKQAAKKTATTAKRNASATKSAAKGTKTSATKTVSAAKKAASVSADKVGD